MSLKTCIHCGTNIPSSWQETSFCCSGCQYVYQLIHKEGLEQYYQLKDQNTASLIGFFKKKKSLHWIKPLIEKTPGMLRVRIQGVQCAACVWLIQEVAKKLGTAHVSVNTAHGILQIRYVDDFPVLSFLETIQSFGYEPSFLSMNQSYTDHNLLLRLGICFALSMNAMMFSASLYTGLAFEEYPLLHTLVGQLNLIIATLAVLIGGSYFIARAYRSVRQKVLHFDLPIALGLSLAYLGSVYAHFMDHIDQTYFDTVTVFITLMLLGRFIQERMIEKNKSRIIQEDALSHLQVKQVTEDQSIKDISLAEIKKGMHLLIHPSSIIAVESQYMGKEPIEIDTSWVTGEPYPKTVIEGETIVQGCLLLGQKPIEVRASLDYMYSDLSILLTQVQQEESLPVFWAWVSKYYALGVLFLTFAGFLLWYLQGDLVGAIRVAVAISVVTCPCSLGIAIPLSRTLAYHRLMASGVLIHEPYTLDRVQKIRNIAFDKTGTLTMGDLVLKNTQAVAELSPQIKNLLFNATARSHHPASRAIFEFLSSHECSYLDLNVHEVLGAGLEIEHEGQHYFLGRKQKQLDDQTRVYTVDLFLDDQHLIAIELLESLQLDAQEVLGELQTKGFNLYLISGDQKKRVQALASRLGFDPDHVFAEQSPKQKKTILSSISDQPTMYVGDGLNDQLALNDASVSALSLHSSLQMSQQADIYYLSQSLTWIDAVFQIASKLKQALYFNLWFLVIYNITTISLAMAGKISPLVCAVIMPLSSLWVIGFTIRKLKS